MTSDGEKMILRELDEIKTNCQAIRELIAQQNGRLRRLELWRAYIVGIGSTVLFVLSGGGLYLWQIVSR